MPVKIILTFVVAFSIAVFSVFNTSSININLMDLKTISMPLSFFAFCVLFIGVLYSGILVIYDQMQKSLFIRRLKKKIYELNDVIEQQEKALTSMTEQEKEIAESLKINELPETEEISGNGKKEVKYAIKDSELTLSQQQREIAISRIQMDRDE